jgi:hypothetical protein
MYAVKLFCTNVIKDVFFHTSFDGSDSFANKKEAINWRPAGAKRVENIFFLLADQVNAHAPISFV